MPKRWSRVSYALTATIALAYAVQVCAQTPPTDEPLVGNIGKGILELRGVLDPRDFKAIPEVPKQDLRLYAAYMAKTYADELFLSADRIDDSSDLTRKQLLRDAESSYVKALGILGGLTGLAKQAKLTSDLLNKDAEYRLGLMRLDLDFWGGTLTNWPGIPSLHLRAMADLLADYEKLNDEITDAVRSQSDNEFKKYLVRASTRRLVADLKASAVTTEEKRSIEDMLAVRFSGAQQKKAAVAERAKAAVSERQSYQRRADAAASACAAAIHKAIVAASGVNPQLVDAIQKRDVTDLVLSQMSVLTEAKKAEILGAVHNYVADAVKANEFVAEAARNYSKLHDAKRQIEGYVNVFHDLRNVAANRSMVELARIGRFATQELQITLPAEVQKVKAQMMTAAPIEAIASTYAIEVERIKKLTASPAQLKQELDMAASRFARPINRLVASNEIWMRSEVGPAVQREVLRLNALNAPDFAQETLRFADAAAAADKRVRESAAKALFQLWGVPLYAGLPDDVKKIMQKHVGEGEGALFQARAARKLTELMVKSGIQEVAGNLFISLDGQRMNLGSLKSLIEKAKSLRFSVPEVEAREIIAQYLEAAARDNQAMREQIVAMLPPSALQQIAEGVSKFGRVSEAARAKLKADLGQANLEVVAQNVAEVQIGSIVASGVVDEAVAEQQRPNGGIEATPTTDVQKAINDAVTRELAVAALNAAMPGMGTIGAALSDYAAGLAAFESNMRQVRHLDNEIKQLIEIGVQEAATADEAMRTLGVVKAGKERDDIYRSAAEQQFEQLANAEEIALDAKAYDRATVLNRRTLVFYIAEKLRQEFDAFERSLGVWVLGTAGKRNVLRSLVINDPNLARLVLDRDIHLFQWLDRARERERGSADALLMHWRQLYRVAVDVCREMGCMTGNAVLGNYGISNEVSLSTVVTKLEWDEFLRWTQQPRKKGDVFRFRLAIGANNGFVPPEFLNARVLDIAIGVSASEKMVSIPVLIGTGGFGMVRLADRFGREAFKPIIGGVQSRSAGTAGFSLRDLEMMLNGDAAVSRRPFTGYAVLGSWELTIPWNEKLAAVKDVTMTLAYFYQVPQPDVVSKVVAMGASTLSFAVGTRFQINATLPKLTLRGDSLDKCVSLWTKHSVLSNDREAGVQCGILSEDYSLYSLFKGIERGLGYPANSQEDPAVTIERELEH